MKIDEWTSEDVHTSGGGEFPPCAGLTSNVLPEAQSTVSAESSQTGVSTRNAHIASKPKVQKEEEIPHWYALRTTYGRERKAYDYMTAKGITAFYPTIKTVKLIKGKRKVVTESRLPNIFFAYGTEEQLKTFVYDNVNLPFLRFYYRHVHVGRRIDKRPLIVPNYQMESLKIICAANTDNIIKWQTGNVVGSTNGLPHYRFNRRALLGHSIQNFYRTDIELMKDEIKAKNELYQRMYIDSFHGFPQ